MNINAQTNEPINSNRSSLLLMMSLKLLIISFIVALLKGLRLAPHALMLLL